MTELTVDILETFISGLTIGGNVISSADDGTNTTITVLNTYHARATMPIFIDTVEKNIVTVNQTLKTITFSTVVASPVAFTLNSPFYFHGTALATSASISYLDDASKVPMIYLHETLRERELSTDSAILRESEMRLFFLDVANYQDWTNDEHYSKRIFGLNQLVDLFILSLKADVENFYTYETEFTRTNHAKWGQFVDLKGHVQSIFNEHLSGIELVFTLPIRKSC